MNAHRVLFAAALAALAGCGRDDGPTAPPAADRVVISSPAWPSMYLGQQQVLQAVVTDDQGNTLNGRSVTWASSDPAVIRVDLGGPLGLEGRLTAIGVGSAAITASSGWATRSVTVVVHPPGPVATIEAPSAITIEYPLTGQLAVVLRDTDRVVLTGRSVTYSTADPAVAAVSAAGLVTAAGPGQTTITAASEGKSGSTLVTVIAPRSTHAFFWTAAGGMQDLGVLPGFGHSSAAAINNSGVVVGTSWDLTWTTTHAFRWTAAGGLADLGTLPGGTLSYASAVNGAGVVVGGSFTSIRAEHAVLWSASGAIQDLGTLQGDVSSWVTGIDDAGRVVGVSRNAAKAHAFLWTAADGMKELPGLLTGYSDAVGINRKGDVIVGSHSQVAGGDPLSLRPYRWSAAGGMSELPLPLGDEQGTALAVNDRGDVLGTSGFDCGFDCSYDGVVRHIMLWPAGGAGVDLTSILGYGTSAVAINATGQIAGTRSGRAILRDALGVHELGLLPNKPFSMALGLNDAGQVVGNSGY